MTDKHPRRNKSATAEKIWQRSKTARARMMAEKTVTKEAYHFVHTAQRKGKSSSGLSGMIMRCIRSWFPLPPLSVHQRCAGCQPDRSTARSNRFSDNLSGLR